MKNFLLIIMCVLNLVMVSAQVGIGTDAPNSTTILDVVAPNDDKGILIPRLTEVQRDAMAPAATENSLLIFNTTENCYNYWNFSESEWKSICGSLGKAQFTFDCNAVTVNGVYIENKELTTANYLSIKVNVTKPGNYSITGETTNGYGFTAAGTFLSTGTQTIVVPAQGTPKLVQSDVVDLRASNGAQLSCPTVNVLTAAGTYTISCAGAQVKGVYKPAVALNSTNYIDVPVTVTAPGSWSITTDKVEGISFSGSGVFSSAGSTTVQLNADAGSIPQSTTIKTLTLTTNSAGAMNTSCQVQVIIVIPAKALLAIGLGSTYGYNISNTGRPSNQLITDLNNYGPNETSTFKYEGWSQIIDGGNGPTLAQWNNYLLGANPVDMVVIGYSWNMSDDQALSMIQYLRNGGVVIMFTEGSTGNQRTMRTLFNDESLTQSTTGGTGDGRTYTLPLTNDPILVGPFGDARGLRWGDDSTDAVYFTGLPASDIFVYSGTTNANSNTGTVSGGVTGFRHKTFNFVWMGEGGFTSQSGNTGDKASTIICPFMIDANNKPIPKSPYGTSVSIPAPIYNSLFFANAIAWAIQQAEFNGINTPK